MNLEGGRTRVRQRQLSAGAAPAAAFGFPVGLRARQQHRVFY